MDNILFAFIVPRERALPPVGIGAGNRGFVWGQFGLLGREEK
jgi:hypothetical protein